MCRFECYDYLCSSNRIMSTFILWSEKKGHLDMILINCNISVSTSVGFVGNLWKSEVRSHFEAWIGVI